LLELFLSSETNPRNAQIVFATHDTNLLDRRLLRRDQIFFCEKEQDATRLYSLADFTLPAPKGGSTSIRNDATFESDYIEGRYGAVPYLGDLRGLFREEFDQEATGATN
jgi:AAA15 family ATPase/GTPase